MPLPLAEGRGNVNDLVVKVVSRHAPFLRGGWPAQCSECGGALAIDDLAQTAGQEVRCLACADLDHLTFLPAGYPCLSRRARVLSSLWAVAVKWSTARRRYERQGLLVQESALRRAEAACLSDADARKRQRDRDAVRRTSEDAQVETAFAQRLRELFPSAPQGVELEIACHACERSSGRVGRSAAARQLDGESITLAVVAHVRHTMTDYDERLSRNEERDDARRAVRGAVDATLRSWQAP